jgi:tetratricopeptide (TPR) repeat protein
VQNVASKDILIARGADLYERLVNWPNQMQLGLVFSISVLLIMLAALFLSMGRFRVPVTVLGVCGLAGIMLAMFVIHEQTVQTQVNRYVTMTRSRYPQSTRFQIRVALLGLPAAATLAMLWVGSTARRRLQASVPQYLKHGRKLLIQGSHSEALAEFNRAIAIAPHLAEAYYNRGCVHEATGELDLALADFDQALRCDPQHAHSYLRRGKIRTEKGELDPALADFDRVMLMRPNDAECYLNRGICLAKKGIVSDAMLDFHRVLKLTNHSDYADPARFYLKQLTADDSSLFQRHSGNGSEDSAESPAIPSAGHGNIA